MGPPGEILVYWPWFVTAVTMELSGIALVFIILEIYFHFITLLLPSSSERITSWLKFVISFIPSSATLCSQ